MTPLAVDLDGTLIRCDLFARLMARFCLARPWHALVLLGWLARGRAHAKAKLAALYPIDAATLPYNEGFLCWLREEHKRGRVLALATAFDQAGADAVARHLGVFAHVFASDGRVNLKSHKKAARLKAAFPGGFAYAGNESADLAVWRAAKSAVVVNAPAWLEARVAREFELERAFPREGATP